jgi:hypothetical protein
MFGAWIVEAAIRYSTNGVRVYEQLGAGANTLGIREAQLTGKINAREAAYLRMYGAQDALARRRADVFSNYSSAVAVAGAVAIGDSVVQAAKLQRTLIAIRNETGANNRELGRFYDTIFKISNTMGVSPAAGADVMLNISRLTAGTLTTAQMQQIAPAVAGFASTINFNRPDVSVEAATQAGIQLSHLFRAYDPASLEKLLDKVYRLSGLMVETPGQAVRQMTYYEPLFKGLKISDDTSIAMMALLDRAGFRQKVGTNVRAMMLEELGPLQLTKHYEAGQGKILEHMGVFGPNMQFKWNLPGGGVDFLGMLHSVSKWAQAQEKAGMPNSQVAKDIYGALGKGGGTIGLLMADPQMLKIQNGILDYLHNQNVSLAAGERNRQDSITFQAARAWGNFQAVMTELGYRATWASGALKDVADGLHGLQEWLHQHRTAESWIGGFGVALAALAAVGTTARITFPVLRFIGQGLFGIYSVGGKAATALSGLGTAAEAAETGAGGAAAALGGLASVLSALAISEGGIKGLESFGRSHVDSKYGAGFYDKYQAYLNGLHGQFSGSPSLFDGRTIPAGGGMTEEQFYQHLKQQGARKKPRTIGLAPSPTVIHNAIARVDIQFPNVKDGPGAAVALEKLLLNPRSELYTGGAIRTHPNIPAWMATAVD